MNAVQLSNVSHRYATHWALANIQLSIEGCSCVAVLGPNGCGKSTLLKILASLLKPTLGTATILGPVAWLGHDLGIYSALTGVENLKFSIAVRGQKPSLPKIQEALEQVGLKGLENKRAGSFSIGMRKRLAIAKILLQEGSIILLDEPHTNLDLGGKSLMNNTILKWKKEGKTLFLASHDHHEVLALCDKVLLLNDGKVVYFGDPNDKFRSLLFGHLS